jgi:hypothetical protein
MPHQKMIRSADAALRAATHQIKQQRFFAIVTTIDSRFADASHAATDLLLAAGVAQLNKTSGSDENLPVIQIMIAGLGGASYASIYLIRFNTDSHNPKTASETLLAPPSPARLPCKSRGHSPGHAGYRE